MSSYESPELLNQYLLLHYGTASEIIPPDFASFFPDFALNYPVRCAELCIESFRKHPTTSPHPVALDLGCSVGRSTFELTTHFSHATGIDLSHSFIHAANQLKEKHSIPYLRTNEGNLTTTLTATLPENISPEKASFLQGDAANPPETLGTFDLILMANLIDRLPNPTAALTRIPTLLKPHGTLVITSPYTWLDEYTPTSQWLGAHTTESPTTFETLNSLLTPGLKLLQKTNLPFLIREHQRKHQFSIAHATVWQKNN